MIKITTGDMIQKENKVCYFSHTLEIQRCSSSSRIAQPFLRLISASTVSHRRERGGWVDGWDGRGTDQGGPEVERIRDL